jgi:drug/metabolite transporter (DMT)-like permease
LSSRCAYGSLSAGVFGTAWSGILVRWSAVPGPVSAFYRFAFAALVFAPWWLFVRRSRPVTTRDSRRAAVIAGVFFAADLALFNSSVMMTNVANASLLGVNAPIFVAFGTWIMYGKRPGARFWFGFTLAFLGLVAIVGTDVVLHPKLGIGDVLALLGAVCYGVYLLYIQRAREAMDTITFSLWTAATAALCLLGVCAIGRQPLTGFSIRSWASLVALAVVAQIMGHLLIARAMGRIPATLSSVVLLAQAPITALLAWPLLGEPLHAAQLLGGALVLAGILVVNASRLSGLDAIQLVQRLRQGRLAS